MASKMKGSPKARRSAKHKTMYAAQFHRTARNKTRQLMKRVDFDPSAAPAIERIEQRMRSRDKK